MRAALVPVALAAALLAIAGAAPAGDPEVPERYIHVDEVKARLDRGGAVVLVDVRPRQQYDEIHIRGALSIPLHELPGRLAEVPRTGVLVLY